MNSDNSFWMLTFVKCNTHSMHKIKMINFTPQKCELLQSACLYVCLSVHTSQTWRNFLFLFTVTVAVARFSLVAMQYVIYFRFCGQRHVFHTVAKRTGRIRSAYAWCWTQKDNLRLTLCYWSARSGQYIQWSDVTESTVTVTIAILRI